VRGWFGNALIIGLIFGVSMLGYYRTTAEVRDIATETHAWACAFKGGLRQDYLVTRDFMRDVRFGRRDPIRGITRVDLLDGQRRRLDRIAETRTLDCS
jgi:hypothetical protein